MNVTMIVPYFKPEITAIVPLVEDLALDLGKYGAKVTVITGLPLRGTGKAVRDEYRYRKEEQISHQVRVLRVGSKREEGKSFFLRGLWHLRKTFVFYRKARRIPSDVYIIYSTPPALGVIGALLAKKAPTLYCLQDLFPDNLPAQGLLKRKGLIYKLLRIMEDRIYRYNTMLLTISEDMKRNLLHKKVQETKIAVIGNWIDTEEIKHVPREANPFFDRFGLNRDAFYVSYCGNLGYAQDVDIILESAKRIREEAPEILYIIVGNGVCESKVKQKIADEGIRNVKLFSLQPENCAAYIYSLGDVGLVTLKPDMQHCAMPSKTWAMMSASQPVVCTAAENTELYETIERSGSGVLVRPGDPDDLAEQILRLYQDRERLPVYGANGRAFVQSNLSRGKATKEYFELCVKLMEREEPPYVSG